MPSDQGPTDPRRPDRGPPERDDRDAADRDAADRDAADWDASDGLGQVHQQRPASDYYDDDPYDDYDDGPRLLARRLVQGGVALLAVVIFLGVVWYAYTWGSRSAATGDVPVVAAPQGPEKVEPEDPGGMDVPHQDKLVLNQDGEGESGQVERLLPPPEEPRPPENSQPAQSGEGPPEQGTAPADGDADGEQVADLPETTVPDQNMPEGEPGANTKGATDGEPSGGDAQAGQTSGTQTSAAPIRTPERKPGGANGSGTGDSETAAADPAQRATGRNQQPAGAPDEAAYAVQIAAFTSEQAARNAWSSYQERFPDILGDQRLLLRNAEVDGQMYWRVRTGPFANRSAAQSLCQQLKARDQSCLPVTR